MTPEPALPASRGDLLVFFPPGIARDGDAICELAAGGQPLGRFTLRVGAATVAFGDIDLPTGARAPDRPVVVRIARGVAGGATCRIIPRAPIILPGLDALFAFDSVAASPGVGVEFYRVDPAQPTALPRGLKHGERQAGAVDHVSVSGGITGWLVDLDRPTAPHLLELRCDGRLLARTLADRPRPATAPFADQAPLGRFSIPWVDVDRTQLARCAPDAAVMVIAPSLAARLDDAYRPITARTAAALAGPELTLAPIAGIPARAPLTDHVGPRVSAVVPSYNYAHYLPQRLGSLLAQDIELILLDDASTDESIAVARALAQRANRDIRIVTSPTNSGAVLPQWRRAATLARGEYLLIAEGDDIADPALIPTLAALLDANRDMAFAFADSAQIDADGTLVRADHKDYYAALGDRALEHDLVLPADHFLLRFLMPRNLVVNVSAMLWRTAALRAAFARIGEAIDEFRATGDWRVYIEACRAGGTIGYVATPLNQFRRHPGSVIGRHTRADHFAEIEAIHALLLSLTGDDPTTAERLAQHRAALRRLWSMDGAGETS